jgi:hypothetical protein
VYRELTRVKQYFDKIKAAERRSVAGSNSQNLSLDKKAAARFITNALVGASRPLPHTR